MTTWKIKLNGRICAVFKFDKDLKLTKISDIARNDLPEKLTQEWHVFDPRKTRMREIKSPKDIYDADLMISAIFYKDKYTIEAEGINWSKVLAKDIPGRLY